MSLETVLAIGNALRNAPDSLKHFKYVSPCPTDKDGNHPFCISIPVLEDFNFDWENAAVITSEIEREKLIFMRFSTSDSDSSPKKYVFGDIYYKRESQFDKNKKYKKTIEYGGCYMLERGNAFENSKKAREEIKKRVVSNYITDIFSNSNNEHLISEVSKYVSKGDNYNPPKKYIAEKDLIIKVGREVIEAVNNISLFKFWDSFSKNLDKIIKILKYAPGVEYALNELKYSKEILNDNNQTLLGVCRTF